MKFDKEVIIKRKITIGDILILGALFIVSIACFSGVLEEGLDTNIGVLIVGMLFGMFFILICPYCTFKRPYFKVNSEGVYAKLPKGFTYGTEQFYSWNKIIENINQYNATNGLENKLVELNDEFIELYIKTLKQYMRKIDKNLSGVATNEFIGII